MTLQEYSILASRTCPDLGSKELNLLHMDMGVNTEIGEALDAIKKHIAYGKPLDKVNIQEEISDCVWYLVNKARMLEDSLPSNPTFTLPYELTVLDEIGLAKELIRFQSSHQVFTTRRNITHIYILSLRYGLNFYQGLENNIAKLRIRYPDKFTNESALNRNLDLERIELEK